MPQIANNLTVTATDIGITGNGRYVAFQSSNINTANNQAIVAELQVSEFLPNRQGLGKARAALVLERKDDGGNWHTVHSLYKPLSAIEYDDTENGGIIPNQTLNYGPNVFNLDGSVEVAASDGVNIISEDHAKRGVLADTVRLTLYLHERDFGNVGQFASITFSLDYELRPQ